MILIDVRAQLSVCRITNSIFSRSLSGPEVTTPRGTLADRLQESGNQASPPGVPGLRIAVGCEDVEQLRHDGSLELEVSVEHRVRG